MALNIVKLGNIIDTVNSLIDELKSFFSMIKTVFLNIFESVTLLVDLLTKVMVYNQVLTGICTVLYPFILVWELGLVIGIVRSFI